MVYMREEKKPDDAAEPRLMNRLELLPGIQYCLRDLGIHFSPILMRIRHQNFQGLFEDRSLEQPTAIKTQLNIKRRVL